MQTLLTRSATDFGFAVAVVIVVVFFGEAFEIGLVFATALGSPGGFFGVDALSPVGTTAAPSAFSTSSLCPHNCFLQLARASKLTLSPICPFFLRYVHRAHRCSSMGDDSAAAFFNFFSTVVYPV